MDFPLPVDTSQIWGWVPAFTIATFVLSIPLLIIGVFFLVDPWLRNSDRLPARKTSKSLRRQKLDRIGLAAMVIVSVLSVSLATGLSLNRSDDVSARTHAAQEEVVDIFESTGAMVQNPHDDLPVRVGEKGNVFLDAQGVTFTCTLSAKDTNKPIETSCTTPQSKQSFQELLAPRMG